MHYVHTYTHVDKLESSLTGQQRWRFLRCTAQWTQSTFPARILPFQPRRSGGNACFLSSFARSRPFLFCRLVQSRELWACMACMALNGKNLQLAEEALAAIQEVCMSVIVWGESLPRACMRERLSQPAAEEREKQFTCGIILREYSNMGYIYPASRKDQSVPDPSIVLQICLLLMDM